MSDILDLTIKINITDLTKMNLHSFIRSYGFIDHEPIKNKLIELYGGNPTFREFPKKLYISALCLNTGDIEYFSRDTHPDMLVVDAICASISIPIVFSAYSYKDKLYIDGACIENTPALPFLSKNYKDVVTVAAMGQRGSVSAITSLKDYIQCVCMVSHKRRVMYNTPGHYIQIPGEIDIMNKNMTEVDKLRLFMLGYQVFL